MILSLLLLMGMQRTCCHVFNGECKAAPGWYSTDNPRGDIVLTPVIKMCAGDLSKCEISPSPQNSYPPQAPHTLPFFTEIPHAAWDAPEPLDVPAIQTGLETIGLGQCVDGPHGKVCVGTRSRTVYGCADKTRILEHDEQVPPLYWCRKVQTGGKP